MTFTVTGPLRVSVPVTWNGATVGLPLALPRSSSSVVAPPLPKVAAGTFRLAVPTFWMTLRIAPSATVTLPLVVPGRVGSTNLPALTTFGPV